MNRIKTIIAIAVLAVFAVGCTDENDIENSTNNQINKKNFVQDDEKYTFYEDKTFSEEELTSMLEEFNNAVNGKGIMPDYDIYKALTNMEFHFNYGIVVKMPYIKDATPYDKLTFTFSVPIENDIIKGSALKDAYTTFVNNVVGEMEGKNLEISDLYVKDVTSTTVTFGLDMEPLRLPFGADDDYLFAFKRLKNSNSVSISAGVTSRWDNLPSWSLILPYGYPSDPYYERGAYEIVVHDHSFERMPSGYFNTQGGILVYGNIRRNSPKKNVERMYTFDAGSTVIWDSEEIELFVKSSIDAANDCNTYASDGYVVYNYSSVVCFSKEIEIGSVLKDKYQLRVQDVKSAKLRLLDISNLHMANITSPVL